MARGRGPPPPCRSRRRRSPTPAGTGTGAAVRSLGPGKPFTAQLGCVPPALCGPHHPPHASGRCGAAPVITEFPLGGREGGCLCQRRGGSGRSARRVLHWSRLGRRIGRGTFRGHREYTGRFPSPYPVRSSVAGAPGVGFPQGTVVHRWLPPPPRGASPTRLTGTRIALLVAAAPISWGCRCAVGGAATTHGPLRSCWGPRGR